MANANDHQLLASLSADMPRVTGRTALYLIVGDPVEQVKAPETFNPIFARHGIDAVLVPVQVAPKHLEAFVRTAFLAPNVQGLWVAIPHKAPMTGVLDHCSELGLMAGAVNAVRRHRDGGLEGGLFDGEGFVNALGYHGIEHAGKRVLIIGAGGGAAAVAASLALPRAAGIDGGAAREVNLFDPTPDKAATVAERIARATGVRVRSVAQPDPAGYDLVVNASPLGLKASDPMPCDVNRLEPHAALVDIVMKNQPTPVVRAARARGLHAQPGFEMMIQQAHLYLDFFGHAEAAESVRRDATALRERIYPAELRSEIAQPFRPISLSPKTA